MIHGTISKYDDCEAPSSCYCSATSMPPCSWCENGIYCEEHDCRIEDCGCDEEDALEDYTEVIKL